MVKCILPPAAACCCCLLLSVLGGCERSTPSTPSTPATPATPATAASTQPTADELAHVRQFVQETAPRRSDALPPGHPPVNNAPQPAQAAPPRSTGPTLKYTAPASWERRPVTGSLRVDDYRLPRVEGDTEDGDLVVFGTNIGGGVEANVERWRLQFATADGQPVPDDAFQRELLDVNGLKVTLVDVAGQFSGMMMSGAGNAPAKKDYRLLGAIVETPAGPWYFKATGPAATMGHHREAFLEFLRSMKLE